MDLLTPANALATIVQLLGVFTQERANARDLTHQQFIEWLNYHKHEQLVNLICSQAAIKTELDNLLRQDHAQILAKLDAIGNTLASLLSRVEGFSALSQALAPAAAVSDQASHILVQLANSASSYFTRIRMRGGSLLSLETGGSIDYTEPRFLEDDFKQLVNLGLLSYEAQKGGDMFRLTRAGARLADALDKPVPDPQPSTLNTQPS